MKPTFIFLVLLALAFSVVAQESKPEMALTPAETTFKELLTNVTMKGRWCSIKDGKMGAEKEDQYVIVSVAKVKGDSWIISTKMKYQDKEMVLPLPIQVKWAGDTAVITVDKMMIPGGGAYSARVLFFERTYAGSWTGDQSGGLISGLIIKN